MPPAMEAIIKEGVNLDGFICPGHVASITGSDIFNFIPEKFKLGMCYYRFRTFRYFTIDTDVDPAGKS